MRLTKNKSSGQTSARPVAQKETAGSFSSKLTISWLLYRPYITLGTTQGFERKLIKRRDGQDHNTYFKPTPAARTTPRNVRNFNFFATFCFSKITLFPTLVMTSSVQMKSRGISKLDPLFQRFCRRLLDMCLRQSKA